MAEQEQEPQVSSPPEDEDDQDHPDYKPPAPKSLDEIVNQDADDESLVKYKKMLLAGASTNLIVEKDNPNKMIVKKMSLLSEGRDDLTIDLTLPAEEIKKTVFVIKEACKYKIKIDFIVQREIVTGVKYHHTVYKKGIQVDKMSQMMGSYGPKAEVHTYTTPEEEAPSGLLMRGDYKIKSKFVDDDKNVYMAWEWHLAVKKEWC